jgi:hypothetical protein
LQELVEFEIVSTPLDAPDALAAHFPHNLTTLKLQYLPDTWPPDKVLPDNWQVHQLSTPCIVYVCLPPIWLHGHFVIYALTHCTTCEIDTTKHKVYVRIFQLQIVFASHLT